MNLSKKKLELVQMILNTERSSVLDEVEAVLKRDSSKEWDLLTDSQKQGIIDAIKDVDSGNGIPYEKVISDIRQKY